jgi:hypothetical protein
VEEAAQVLRAIQEILGPRVILAIPAIQDLLVILEIQDPLVILVILEIQDPRTHGTHGDRQVILGEHGNMGIFYCVV